MFEKLSEVLKKATDKVANAIFLDKNLVDSIIKDLQRALIEADVNIVLVKDLSDKIRKAAFDERISGLEKKEHLIKVLHDELSSILGDYQPLKLKKEKNKIMLLGLYGAGKCVHAESKIQLENGEIIKAEELYERYNDSEEDIEDGKIINVVNKELFVPSFNPKNLKIENKRATHLWKLKKEKLIEVKLDNGNGFSVKVTPEHPFFVLRGGQVIQIRADEITEQDFISVPNKIEISGKRVNLFNEIKDLDLDVYLSPEEIKMNLPKNGSLKEICKNLKHKRNYAYLTHSIKKGKIPLELANVKNHNSLKIKGQKEKKVITFPLFLSEEFSEFLGYVIGDGYLSKSYIEITNEDREIISRIIKISKSLFNITPTLTKDKRAKNLYQIRLNSRTFVKLLEIFNLHPGKKGRNLEIPKQIIKSDNETIRKFLRAYFDCDSHPSTNKRQIELVSEGQNLVQQTSLLLRRFGILSSISKKIVNKTSYWRLIIKAKYAEIYASKIGYEIKRKKDSAEKYKEIGLIQGSGNQDMIPLGNSLKALRIGLGFSIGEIQKNAVYSYWIYEKKGLISREQLKKLVLYYKLRKRGIFLNILEYISNNISLSDKYSHRAVNGILKYLKDEVFIESNETQTSLSEKGQQYLQLIKESNLNGLLESLEIISNSDICWIPVNEINPIKNNGEFVYDLTVEDNHSFLAEGIIVHNTTTITKLGNYFSKRGQKTALIGLDTHRPAASEQLQQLAEKNKLSYFIDAKEKDPIKIVKKYEKNFKDFNVILFDTAGRHTLDKSLITEIKSLNKEIKPTETILVLPADIGQAAKKQAQEFLEAINITGVIITRMDSTAKGGGALTACAETKAPIYFLTTGEKINDIEEFNPKTFLSRLLGMGDLETLMEKIRSVTDESKTDKMQKKLAEGKLTLEDVVEQVKSMGSIGGFDKIKTMIPGFSNVKDKIPEGTLENQEARIAKWEHIIKSMTKEEKENPEILEKQTSRITRVAKGAGVHNSDVRALLKQYKLLNEMIKSGFDESMATGNLSQKQLQKLAKKFGKVKKIRF